VLLRAANALQSTGCNAPMTIGEAGVKVGPINLTETSAILGQRTEYWLTLPADYDPSVPYPLILYFHGWGGSGEQQTSGLYSEYGYILVSPSGYNDFHFRTRCKAGGTYGAGSPDGRAVCGGMVGSECYVDSCGHCADNCGWTTCEDSAQQVLWLLEEVQDAVCVDLDKVYAAGYSNGATFSWDLVTNPRTGNLFAGSLTSLGSQVGGFLSPPVKTSDLTVVAYWGTYDAWMPPFAAGITNTRGRPGVAQDKDEIVTGYYYQSARSTTSTFARALGCTGGPVTIDVSAYNDSSLTCFAWLACNPGARVVECIGNTPHAWSTANLKQIQMDSIAGDLEPLWGKEALEVKEQRMGQWELLVAIPRAIANLMMRITQFIGAFIEAITQFIGADTN